MTPELEFRDRHDDRPIVIDKSKIDRNPLSPRTFRTLLKVEVSIMENTATQDIFNNLSEEPKTNIISMLKQLEEIHKQLIYFPAQGDVDPEDTPEVWQIMRMLLPKWWEIASPLSDLLKEYDLDEWADMLLLGPFTLMLNISSGWKISFSISAK